jgi:hypothetical protein
MKFKKKRGNPKTTINMTSVTTASADEAFVDKNSPVITPHGTDPYKKSLKAKSAVKKAPDYDAPEKGIAVAFNKARGEILEVPNGLLPEPMLIEDTGRMLSTIRHGWRLATEEEGRLLLKSISDETKQKLGVDNDACYSTGQTGELGRYILTLRFRYQTPQWRPLSPFEKLHPMLVRSRKPESAPKLEN